MLLPAGSRITAVEMCSVSPARRAASAMIYIIIRINMYIHGNISVHDHTECCRSQLSRRGWRPQWRLQKTTTCPAEREHTSVLEEDRSARGTGRGSRRLDIRRGPCAFGAGC